MTQTEIAWQHCAVCGFPLEHAVRGGEHVWLHARERYGDSDHVAVPVDVTDLSSPSARCDICDEQPVTHELDVDEFVMPSPTDHETSVGGWALCATCAPIMQGAIKSGNVGRLVQRAADVRKQRGGSVYRPWLRACYERLLAHHHGDVLPLPEDGTPRFRRGTV